MDPVKTPSSSRLYSAARMKRRANLNEINIVKETQNQLPVKKQFSTNPELSGVSELKEKTKLNKIPKKNISDSENIQSNEVYLKKNSTLKNLTNNTQNGAYQNQKTNKTSLTSVTNLPVKLSHNTKSNESVAQIQQKPLAKRNSTLKNPTNNSKNGVHQSEKTKLAFLSNLSEETNNASLTSLLDQLSDDTTESNDSLELEKTHALVDPNLPMSKSQEDEKIKILATLLPDEVLRNPTSRSIRSFEVALLFADVSGFTQLCEKYDKTGMGGPSRLTEVLNELIGSMINIVLIKNGDVCKFGGDAFLCVWKVTENSNLQEVVHLAIETAVDIQKNCGKHKVDSGAKLSVKIAVSAGKAYFAIIGSNTRKQYVIVGSPVMEVRDAEQISKAGDVIVTSSAWQFVDNNMYYSFTYSSNNKYIKVNDFGPLWKSAKEIFKNKRGTMQFKELRPLLKYTSRMKIEDIQPFILPPVMRNLDFNRPLEYLTEMRQIAVVFFNLIPDFDSLSSDEIIHLCDIAVQIVTEAVSRNGGVTNKLTLFDKDMVILTVFGLKGFKHELASQVALKCAYTCLKVLKGLKKINSVSAGVTTGMVYCGVIGHTLRREYTVMGHPVNMAARLMCSYQNIVSCDRNTFLHSKLESDYFQLLEYQYMKGIQNSGPFYKFTLDLQQKKLKLDFGKYPILGREKEIKQFEEFLRNRIKSKEKHNFMIIFGKARIGKSRLVAKLITVAEKLNSELSKNKKIPILEICVIPLTENYLKISYSCIRLIFQSLLGLDDTSSKEEWKDRILSKFGEMKFFNHLASLNPIFQINFPFQAQYLNLNHHEQTDAQMILVKDLYSKCSPKAEKWLIVIEDAEFIDEETWNLLKWFSDESEKIIYLLTIGQRVRLSNAALNCIESVNANKITLSEIEKWFYSPLACQILGVKAIPVELENLLQNYKSSGNPGWLESFLLSLKQTGSIQIKQASAEEAKALGLVLIPDLMLRNTESDGEKDFSDWKNYLKTFETIVTDEKFNLPVCVLGKNFKSLTTNETELTMDVMLLKTFDTLIPLQQLVLKVGSVLGNNIKRKALKFVIEKETTVEEKSFAKAIKSLFEINILICAKQNLAQTNLLIPRKMVLVSSIQTEVTCACTELIIPDSCKNYPKYANCGYMQYRSPTFRDTVYNLLLDEQKKKFHSSCIEFLRKNTFKCSACDNIPITDVLGYEENNQVILACTVTPLHGIRSTKLEPDLSKSQKNKKKSSSKDSIESQKYSLSIRGDSELVSITDRGDCQCAEILSSVYSVLLDHASGSGRNDIKLEVLLEYASVTLTMYNLPLTMQILEEALNLIDEMKEKGEHPEICVPYVYSKIYALMGITKLYVGRLDDSLELLKRSLKYLNTNYPKNEFRIKLLTPSEALKFKMKTEIFPRNSIGKVSTKKAHFMDLLSECFGFISIVYMYKQKLSLAKYASLNALNKALDSNSDFFGLCIAYRTMIEVAYLSNNMKDCPELELSAISTCKRCPTMFIELFEWEAICQLYKAIFQTRHVRAEIENAVAIGFQGIRIASVIRNTTLKLDLIPDMILALIQLNRLSEAVALLRELEFMSTLDTDKSSRLWYYTLCLDFHLYTGFMIVSHEICENFLKDEDDLSLVRDPDAKYRLYTSLWLWCVRTNEWELSKSHNKTLESYNLINYKETPCNVFTRLKRLEGLLITLVHRMDLRSIYSINKLYSEIHSLMNHLEKDIKIVKLFQPRYQVLKCYYKQIRLRNDNYFGKLKSAQNAAENMKDLNLYHWIDHLRMVWSHAISMMQRDFWIEHSDRNQLEWQESNRADKKAVMYSLPLPKF